jgi:hypothetical protein
MRRRTKKIDVGIDIHVDIDSQRDEPMDEPAGQERQEAKILNFFAISVLLIGERRRGGGFPTRL